MTRQLNILGHARADEPLQLAASTPATYARSLAASDAAVARQSPARGMLIALCTLACMIALACSVALAPEPALASDRFVHDNYALFSSSDLNALETQARATSEKYDVGVYLLVVDNIGQSSARDYAINYYRNADLGLGAGKSGILFLVAVNSRDYVTITYGDGINAFTDYQIEQMEDAIVSELRHDRWLDAAHTYLDLADYTLAFRAEHGEPLDYNNAPLDPGTIVLFILIALAIAGVVAGLWCATLYSQMKTARQAVQASQYLDRNSFALLAQDDQYITSSVVATPRASSSSSRGGFRGGSSIGSGGFGGSSGGKF